jgi:putative transposase
VVVHPADEQDRDGAYTVLAEAADGRTPRVKHVWLDAGYRGPLLEWIAQTLGWSAEVVTRAPDQVGFAVQPRRWVVERTFGWLGRFRRLSKDYEEDVLSSEAWIRAAMTVILVRRLAHVGVG